MLQLVGPHTAVERRHPSERQNQQQHGAMGVADAAIRDEAIVEHSAATHGARTELKRRKRVLASYDEMKKVVEKLDTARTGNITARDLNNALDKLGIKMRSSDFARLAGEVDPSSSGRFASGHLPPLGQGATKGASKRQTGVLPRIGENQRQQFGQRTRLSTVGKQAVASGEWRRNVASKMSRHWKQVGDVTGLGVYIKYRAGVHFCGVLSQLCSKQLHRDFKRHDPNSSGVIDMHVFLLALEVYSIVLEPDDADALYMQLGVGSSGKIRWAEFLKCFVGSGLQARQQERPGAISAPILGSCSKNAAHAPSEIDAYMRNAAMHWRAIRQACQIVDQAREAKRIPREREPANADGLRILRPSKTLSRREFKGVLLKLGASAPESVLDAVCRHYCSADMCGTHGDYMARTRAPVNKDLVEYTRFVKDLARLFPSL